MPERDKAGFIPSGSCPERPPSLCCSFRAWLSGERGSLSDSDTRVRLPPPPLPLLRSRVITTTEVAVSPPGSCCSLNGLPKTQTCSRTSSVTRYGKLQQSPREHGGRMNSINT